MLTRNSEAGKCSAGEKMLAEERSRAVSTLREMFLALFEEAREALDEVLDSGALDITETGLVVRVDQDPDAMENPPISSFEYAYRDIESVTVSSTVHGQIRYAQVAVARDSLTRELTGWVRAVLNHHPWN
jgi:hypothetical protein